MVTMYRQPAATLIIRRGPAAEQQFAITEPAVTVGRHRSCDIQVDEPEVSRQHARITWSGTGYVIEDLGSVNGTFVNGERISAPRVLQDGDIISLGSRALLAFQVSPPAQVPPRPAAPSPAYAPRSPAKRRSRILVPVIALLGLCFILSAMGGLAYFFWPQEKPTPIILVATLTPTPLPGRAAQVLTPAATPPVEVTVLSTGPVEPPVVSPSATLSTGPVESPVVSPSATLSPSPVEPTATEHPPATGAVRLFPDTSDGTYVFNDQLAGGSMSEEQFRFAVTHYVGCQKMTRTDTRHLRQYDPGFIVLHYRLGLGLGYQEPDDACRPNGNWLHFLEGDEWVREWPGDEVMEEGWFFPWAGQPRVYNCDWGWYVMELNDPGWRARWSDEVIAQMAANEADGLFADSFSVPNYLGADHYNPPLPGMDAAFEEAWARRIEDFIAYLQGRFGEYYLIPNVGQWVATRNPTDYSGVDGVMIEGFSEWEPHSPFDLTDWQLQMNRILDLTRQDKVIIAQSYLWDPEDVETRLFYLGNYLLVKGRHSYINIDYSMEPEYFPEYDIELGSPLDELPTEIDGYFNAAWGVYNRRYANGLVLVNPGPNTRSIDLGGTYYLAQPSGGGLVPADSDISAWLVQYGPVDRIELAPNQAAILLNVIPQG